MNYYDNNGQSISYFLPKELALPPSVSSASESSARLRLRFERKERRRCSEYNPLVDTPNDRDLSGEQCGSLAETLLIVSSPCTRQVYVKS